MLHAGEYNNNKESTLWVKLGNGSFIPWIWVTLDNGDDPAVLEPC
jgi:hypothetical protein